MKIATNAPHQLNMADLESKGETFNSPLIVINSNSVGIAKGCKDPNAFYRRRHIFIESRGSPEWSNVEQGACRYQSGAIPRDDENFIQRCDRTTQYRMINPLASQMDQFPRPDEGWTTLTDVLYQIKRKFLQHVINEVLTITRMKEIIYDGPTLEFGVTDLQAMKDSLFDVPPSQSLSAEQSTNPFDGDSDDEGSGSHDQPCSTSAFRFIKNPFSGSFVTAQAKIDGPFTARFSKRPASTNCNNVNINSTNPFDNEEETSDGESVTDVEIFRTPTPTEIDMNAPSRVREDVFGEGTSRQTNEELDDFLLRRMMADHPERVSFREKCKYYLHKLIPSSRSVSIFARVTAHVLQVVMIGVGVFTTVRTIRRWFIPDARLVACAQGSGDRTAANRTTRSRQYKLKVRTGPRFIQQAAELTAPLGATIRNKIDANILRVEVLRPDGTNAKAHGLVLAGRLFMMPRHLIYGALEEGRVFTVRIFGRPLYTTSNQNDSVIMHVDANQVMTIEDDGRLYDLAFFELSPSIKLFPDITGHFAPEKFVNQYSQFPISFKGITSNATLVHAVSRVRHGYGDGKEQVSYIIDPMVYPIETKDGDCGIPIYHVPSANHCQIVGIHRGMVTRGVGSGEGTGDFVGTHIIQMALDFFRPVQRDAYVADLLSEGNTHIDGDMTILGWTSRQEPDKSSFLKVSILNNVIGETKRAPAILTARDPRWVFPSKPLAVAVGKYGNVFKLGLDPILLEKARLALNQYLGISKMQGSVLSVKDIILGHGTVAMPKDTSCGIPYADYGLKREDLIDFENGIIKSPLLQQRYDMRLSMARTGHIVTDSMWKDFAKDELLKEKKILEGRTRHVTAGPIDLLILTKQYTADFCNAITRHERGIMIGMNCESLQWNDMIKRLLSYNTKGYAADARAFDGSINGEMIYALCKTVQEFYPPEASLIIKVIFEEIVHTMSRCGDLVYQKHTGNPSGCAVTSYLNSYLNMLIFFYSLARKNSSLCTAKNVLENVGLCMYGDDAVVVFRDGFSFGFQDLVDGAAAMGICMTNEMPEDRAYPIKELPFLKRHSREYVYEGATYWIPVMDLNTISDIMNWTRAKNEIMEPDLIQNRVYMTQIFIWFYGKKKFTNITYKIQKRLEEYGITVDLFSYKFLKDKFFSTGIDTEVLWDKSAMDSFAMNEPKENEVRAQAISVQYDIWLNMWNWTSDNTQDRDGSQSSLKEETEEKAEPENEVHAQGQTYSYVQNHLVAKGSTVTMSNPVSASGDDFDRLFSPTTGDLSVSGFHANEWPETELGIYRDFSGYMSNVDIPTVSERFSLRATVCNPAMPEHFSTTKDEMLLSELMGRMFRIKHTAWALSAGIGIQLSNGSLNPWGSEVHAVGTSQEFMGAAGLFSMLSSYWRGSIRYRVEVVCSNFHRGRLCFAVFYNRDVATAAAYTLNETTNTYNVYLDVVNGIGDVTIDVPYQSRYPYLNHLSEYYTDISKMAYGSWTLTVINPLVAPDSVSPIVDVNIYACAAEDMSFHYPTAGYNLDGPTITYIPPTPVSVNTAINEVRAQADCCETTTSTSHVEASSLFTRGKKTAPPPQFGENIVSIRDLLRRFQFCYLVAIPVDGSGSQTTSVSAINILGRHQAFWQLGHFFRYMRGQIRFRFVLLNLHTISSDESSVVQVAATAYSPYANDTSDLRPKMLYNNVANCILGVAAPVKTITLPYLSSDLNYTTPWNLTDSNQNSLNAQFHFFSMRPNVATEVVYVAVYCAVGDDFRLGCFLGTPSLTIQTGAPDFPAIAGGVKREKQKEQRRRDTMNDSDAWSVLSEDHLPPGIPKARRPRRMNDVRAQAEHVEPTENVLAEGVMAQEDKPAQSNEALMVPRNRLFETTVTEASWSVVDTLTRWNRVATITWVDDAVLGTQLAYIPLPSGLFQNEIFKMAFENFEYWRAGFELRFQVNGTPMHAGRLAAAFLPGYSQATFNGTHADLTSWITQVNHVMLSPTSSTVADLQIPFVHQALMCSTPTALNTYNSVSHIGSVFVVVFNQLTIGGTGSTAVNINVLVRLTDPHMMIPKIRQTIT
jgi:hypothetical protein